jgi:RNA polymerase sigma-70 factor (ECF subfamily)
MDVRSGDRPGALGTAQSEREFEETFHAHYAEVYRLLYRITGSQEQSEDLAQEAFLRLHRQRFEAGREHNVRAWLYRVAANLAYNVMRDERRRAQRDRQTSAADNQTGADSSDPQTQALRALEIETVRRTLVKLPERQAFILMLRYAGLSYREVAAAIDVAPASVGTLLARAEAAFEAAYEAVES